MSRILAMIALLSGASAPALAQTGSLVVPPGSTVVIGPRSQPAPRPHLAPARPQQQRMVVVSPQGETLSGPAGWVAAGMAAAALAAVLFAGGSGGGGGGSSGGSATGSASGTVGR
ncbi:hypothetical protein GXW78_14835 [Roseomonas terrae]|jgi:hypothetical protein|uniref:Uncharacterized protein n=1 Tax=Neoroseomonas terrae TaxID=424799 RepID=A0ABS5EIU1_9PROT|nr:hypothetical protein [Neoroseomonas terrae]MBR0650947.1 hypothetical protein [Neoroseomonas terrae]